MSYKLKASFYSISETVNDYQEVMDTAQLTFTTGVSSKTQSFRDRVSAGQAMDGQQLYLYARKNPNTLSVEVNDYVKLPSLTNRWFKVLGIDPMYDNRSEILFYVDRIATDAVIVASNGELTDTNSPAQQFAFDGTAEVRIIEHNMGRPVLTEFVDDYGERFVPKIIALDENRIEVRSTPPLSGTLYVE